MKPIETILNDLASLPNLRTEGVNKVAANVCRYLKGILEGAFGARSYITFFQWISSQYLPILLRLLETWWDEPKVTTAILEFIVNLYKINHIVLILVICHVILLFYFKNVLKLLIFILLDHYL